MDGVGNTHGGVLVLGATNVPWELDPGILLSYLHFLIIIKQTHYFIHIILLIHIIFIIAMRRRFEKRVYIALPETQARVGMFRLNLGDTPNAIIDEEFHSLGENSNGYSGSDVAVVVREVILISYTLYNNN